jgi:serine/threonine protein kinase
VTAPHLGPGQVVAGKYTIRALLGFTGEVATYHATGPQGDVALKLYDPAIGQRADLMSELQRKRELVMRLPRDAVAPVIDSGFDVATSAPFSVTEHLLIPSVRRLVEMGPLSPEVVSKVMSGLARVIDAAHAMGLYHHSLKPSNVFVGPAPHYAVRITDFSDAVVRSATPTHEAYAHAAPWWAPEQIQAGAALGAPADIFSATLVVFYALTGRSYWMSCQASPPDLPGWQLEVMGQRVPASVRAQELGAGLNAALDGVMARALSVNQPDRPRSLSEIAQVLASLGGGAAAALPESKTLAFGGGYPPAPGPSGGGASGPGYPTAQSSPGGYAAHAGPVPGTFDPNAPTPGLPPFPQPKKKSGSPVVPVMIAVVIAILVGGAAVFFLFLRGGGDAGTTAAASASASASAAAAGSVGTASSSARTARAAPSSPAGAGSSANPDSDDGGEPEKVSVTFRCAPDCEKVEVDGEEVELADDKASVDLLPGKHRVIASREGYLMYKKTIDVELGKPIEHKIALSKIQARRSGGGSKGKPCGGFLNPCK